MAKDPQDPGTIDTFPCRGRPPIGDRPMTAAERKRRSRVGKRSYAIMLGDDAARRFDLFCDRMGMTPSACLRWLVFRHPVPRKKGKARD